MWLSASGRGHLQEKSQASLMTVGWRGTKERRGMDWGAIGAPGAPRQVGVTAGLCGLAARLGG